MNLVLTVLLACAGLTLAAELDILYEWKYIDYVWDNDAQKENAIENGEYNYATIIPFDFANVSDKVLVTTPRFYNNPASLSTISNTTGDGGPLLEPYPSWDWHTSTDCTGITSVNRVYLDKCNRLWAVDSGKIGDVAVCPARIFAFNAATDELMKNITIPDELTHNSVNKSNGRLEIQAVETSGDSCDTTWLYIGDPEGYGLVIWNGSAIWRLEHDVYAPDPEGTLFSVGGENVTLELGIFNLEIVPPDFMADEYLLFGALSSKNGYAATLDDLHNSNTLGNTIKYYKSNYTYPSQLLARIFSDTGALIGGGATRLLLSCWNIQYPLAPEYTAKLFSDDDILQFPSAAKIFNKTQDGVETEQYWELTNRFQKYVLGTMDFEDVNFRILGSDVASLINGTICEPVSHNISASIEDKFYFEYEIASVVHSSIPLDG